MAAPGTRSYTMAAEAAAGIVSQKLEILLSPPEWVGCLAMETVVKDAKAKLAKIQKFLSTLDSPFESTEWLWRLLQTMYNAEDILDKFHLKVAHGRHEALHVATRPLVVVFHKYMLWRDLSNLVKAMEELCQDKYMTDTKVARGENEKEPASSSSLDSTPWEGHKLARLTSLGDGHVSMNFVCREAEKKRIKEWIRMKREGVRARMEREGVRAISIWGERGTGKTFLARWIYREAMYLGFDTRAWVLVSASMDQQEFFFEILKQVEKRARGMMNIDEIKKMLAQKLASTKKFLIVLDDMCTSTEEFFGWLTMIIQPSSSQGHIIITTQDKAIANSMSDDPEPIELKRLCNGESGRMLAMKLHRGCHVPSLTDEYKILNRIPALPLCISLLSGLLSNAKEQGLTALMNDKSAMSVSDLLELSYHRLPFHLKPCFIYMALFPVAFPIPTRRLVRLWLAEGLLVSHCYDGERKMTPEEVGEIFILELVDRNVIDVVSWRANGSPKACQMLTSLYELICLTTISTGFLHVHNNSNLKGRNDHNPSDQQEQLPDLLREQTKVRWLAEHTNIVREGRRSRNPNLNLSHIRSFLSFYLRRGMLTRDIRTFLGNMTSDVDYSLLRVLDLEGVYKPSLQGMLSKLVLLRYLGLRSTVLDLIPSEVADLHYLETLDIKHTNVTSLPNSLWKARNLRHLHLNWFYIDLKKILKVCGNNVMALNKIQTLSGLVICEVKENFMTGHMNSLTTLTTLKLFLQHSGKDTSGAAGETVAHWISSSLTNLQSLTFGVIQEAKPVGKDKPPTSRIGLLPKLGLAQHHKLFELYLLGQLNEPIWRQLLSVSLRVLTLSGSNVERNMMPELGSLLKNLRTFRLLANSFLDTSLKFVKDGFQSLMILKIWNLPHLKEVIIEPGAIPHLKELEFRQIKGLETVRGIKECEELENICVIYQSDALVNQLKGGIGKNTNLCVVKDTRGPDPQVMTKTDGDGNGEMMHPLCEKNTTRPGSADDDHGKLWGWLRMAWVRAGKKLREGLQ